MVTLKLAFDLRLLGKYALLIALPLTFAASAFSTGLIPRIYEKLKDAMPLGLYRSSLKPFLGALFVYSTPYDTYRTLEQENAYWEDAEIAQRELSLSDARFVKGYGRESWCSVKERQILYYTPRLLPVYRDGKPSNSYESDISIPTRAFVKWHWLTFPDRPHPSFLQASRLIRRFSARDLREIHRVSKLARSSRIGPSNHRLHGSSNARRMDQTHTTGLGKVQSSKFRKLWSAWLRDKEPDIVICFEE